ncbi:MAG TPA: hypothetical protein VMD91_06160 [Candidatus Sulfotelmatobacter sp.]|nr:hypothetical protein [Candidatus Sulfotelmatobacter sp.]
MNDSGRPAVPHPPYDELRGALGEDDDAQGAIDALQADMEAPRPDPKALHSHLSLLRALPELEARIANWWDAPETQAWVKQITDSGL